MCVWCLCQNMCHTHTYSPHTYPSLPCCVCVFIFLAQTLPLSLQVKREKGGTSCCISHSHTLPERCVQVHTHTHTRTHTLILSMNVCVCVVFFCVCVCVCVCVCFYIPSTDSPSIFSAEEGEGWHLMLYFTLTHTAREMLGGVCVCVCLCGCMCGCYSVKEGEEGLYGNVCVCLCVCVTLSYFFL
jgi:hypothetical protein